MEKVFIIAGDGIMLEVSRKRLSVLSDIFPEDLSEENAIDLPESSHTLSALFNFDALTIDKNTMLPEVIASLAEASEKYCVVPALTWCQLAMRYDLTPFQAQRSIT